MLYESDRDREEQTRFAEWAYGDHVPHLSYEMTKPKSHWDITMFLDGHLFTVIEFKRRTKTTYPTLAIDVSKINILVETARFLHAFPMLVVKREDVGGYWGWLCDKENPKGKMKRKKRRGIYGETAEKEDEVYLIPYSNFFEIQGPPF